jgi:hypothetical protein
VELDKPLRPLRPRREERSPEVIRPLPLPKARASNSAHTRGIQHAEAVELIRRDPLLLSLLDRLGRQCDGGEEVHGPLRLAALHALHLLERLVQGVRARLEPREDAVVLLPVQRVARLALLGWVHHHLDDALPNHRRAELDADELVDLSGDLRVEADELEVAAAVAAFAHHAFGDGVQRGELDVVVLAGRLLLQVAEGFFEGDELADEDVGLVDFVGDDDELVLGGELEHALDVLGGERGAGGVARVDDADGLDVGALGHGLVVALLDGGHAGAPVGGLVEEVGYAAGVEDGEGGGVERVLGDGHHDACLGLCADDVQQRVDAGRGAVAEVDAVDRRGVPVAALDVFGDRLADASCALRLRVCADAVDVLEQLLRARNHVRLVAEGPRQDVLVLQQLRVLQQRGDLAEECDGLLVELLRVADVGGDDRVEGQVLALALGQLRAVRLRLDGQLAADGILGRADVRVDVVEREDRLGLGDAGRHGAGGLGGGGSRGRAEER